VSLRCPHCSRVVVLSLVAAGPPAFQPVHLDPAAVPASPPKRKAKTCACGHDAHEGPCQHGKGTAFGGCPCEGQHSRRRSAKPAAAGETKSPMSKGERIILATIVQLGCISSAHLTIVTGYKRSTRNAYLARLVAAGFIEEREAGWFPTHLGRSALPDVPKLPTGADLAQHYLDTLPEGESTLLAVLLAENGRPIERDVLGEVSGYKRSTRNAYLQRLAARQLVVDVDRETVRASEMLFDKAKA
jgi:hypothetical protein